MLSLVFLFLFTQNIFAEIIQGKKFSNSRETDAPFSMVPAIKYDGSKNNFNVWGDASSLDLSTFMLPSPYQGAAGSCLFMSLTGTVEWWLAKSDNVYPKSEGQYDLSERVFMNLSKMKVGQSKINNWRTDSVERLNTLGKSILNTDWRYTKGWFKRNSAGTRVPTYKDDKDGEYSISYNWVKELNSYKGPYREVPKFKTEVLYADAERNQWAIGKAPKTIVKDIKAALNKRKAPVNVIFNLHGYWHAVVIVGYDDKRSTEGCPLLNGYEDRMKEKSAYLKELASKEENATLRKKYLKKAAKQLRVGKKVSKTFYEKGGCNKKGVFLVRDSIYKNEQAPLYDYDPSNIGDEEHYTHKVVLREYKFMEVLGNHAFQIYPAH